MRLYVLSDLHVEFADFTPPAVNADGVLLAGDIHVGWEGAAWALKNFPATPVVYVLGNHEFYRHATPELVRGLERDNAGSHLHVLENSVTEIGGVTFLGCTLWTDFRLMGDAENSQLAAEDIMADYHIISVSPEYRRLRAKDTVRLHHESVKWLANMLAQHNRERTVVVTHHAPSLRSIPPWHQEDLLTAAFASELEPIIAASGIPLWVHGHTHYCVDYRIGKTRVLSNQRGYPGEGVAGFNPGLVVEL